MGIRASVLDATPAWNCRDVASCEIAPLPVRVRGGSAMDAETERARVVGEARRAVEREPEKVDLRLALAKVLRDSGDTAGALEQFMAVLGRDPANVEALQGAADCTAALGDVLRAEGYRRLLAAVKATAGGSQVSGRPSAAPQTPGVGSGGPEQPAAEPVRDQATPSGVGFLRRPRLRVVTRGEPFDAEMERPTIMLADVAGMEAVKRRLTVAFLAPMRDPRLRKAYVKSLRGGLLLYGPPGCGKTFMARATAGELGARFVSVGLSDVLDMWLGESERKLHELFEKARKHAPVVLFFDELDAIGQKRSHLKHHAGRTVVNQLLAELDGVGHENEGLFVLGATNHPWDVDTALLRPGRFDRMLLVLPPDEAAREAILRSGFKDRPTEGLDLHRIAARTQGFSGADLAHLCETAAENAMEASAGSGILRPISPQDVQRALTEVRSSTRPWFDTAKNYAMFANEGGVYDELLAYMQANKML
jgi:AAA+ superfamily predicted ATPase